MASKEEEKEQERIWLDVFKLFDKDNNGTICPKELGFVMRALNLDPTQKELNEAMDTLGKNGKITFEEFKNYMKKKKMSSAEERRQDMLNAFKLMDKNSDKHLDASELISVLTRLGEPLSTKEAEAMIRVADVNKDGKIDYEEFVDFIISPYLSTDRTRRDSTQRKSSFPKSNTNNQSTQPQQNKNCTSNNNNNNTTRPTIRQPRHHFHDDSSESSNMSTQSLGFQYKKGSSDSMNNYYRSAGDKSTDSDFSMMTQPEITDTSDDATLS